MTTIDLRSDTVTKPTAAMRRAMAEAEVGDDVYGEDPNINRLQQVAAKLIGKDASIFVPSGTMANQTALRVLTSPGDLVLAGEGAHVVLHESGGAAALAGVQIQTIGTGGLFDADDVRGALPPDDHHYAPATVVALENTQNHAGGRVFPLAQIEAIAAVARERGLRLHLDGARLFNAVVATGIPAPTWTKHFDTVSFCLSKGLGAPVGSLVCASAALVDKVHRFRKMYGGGMRQAGILAAAGLHALEHHTERLAEDHANARRLADGLSHLGLEVDPPPETNIVLFRVPDTGSFLSAAYACGVPMLPVENGRIRAVTHLDVSGADIDEALNRIESALGRGRARKQETGNR